MIRAPPSAICVRHRTATPQPRKELTMKSDLYRQTRFTVFDKYEHEPIVIPANGTRGLRSERRGDVLVHKAPRPEPADPVMDLALDKTLTYLAHRCMGTIGIRKFEVYVRFTQRKDANLFEKLCKDFFFIERSELVYFIKRKEN